MLIVKLFIGSDFQRTFQVVLVIAHRGSGYQVFWQVSAILLSMGLRDFFQNRATMV
jgi:hypothetical protein